MASSSSPMTNAYRGSHRFDQFLRFRADRDNEIVTRINHRLIQQRILPPDHFYDSIIFSAHLKHANCCCKKSSILTSVFLIAADCLLIVPQSLTSSRDIILAFHYLLNPLPVTGWIIKLNKWRYMSLNIVSFFRRSLFFFASFITHGSGLSYNTLSSPVVKYGDTFYGNR